MDQIAGAVFIETPKELQATAAWATNKPHFQTQGPKKEKTTKYEGLGHKKG